MVHEGFDPISECIFCDRTFADYTVKRYRLPVKTYGPEHDFKQNRVFVKCCGKWQEVSILGSKREIVDMYNRLSKEGYGRSLIFVPDHYNYTPPKPKVYSGGIPNTGKKR